MESFYDPATSIVLVKIDPAAVARECLQGQINDRYGFFMTFERPAKRKVLPWMANRLLVTFSITIVTCASSWAASFDENSARITNTYFPLNAGVKFEYIGFGDAEGIAFSFQVSSSEMVDGVRCLKLRRKKWFEEEQVLDEVLFWMAQDVEGNVWSLRSFDVYADELNGPEKQEFDEEDQLWMPARPVVGKHYLIEQTDYELKSLTETKTISLGRFTNCLLLRNVETIEDTDEIEELYFAPGTGLIRYAFEGSENGRWDLLKVTGLRAPSETFSISGYVKEGSATGPPLPNVSVELSIGNAVSTTLTDTQGRYEFAGQFAGNYVSTPTAEGYDFIPTSQSVYVDSDTVVGTFVGVPSCPCSALPTIQPGTLTRKFENGWSMTAETSSDQGLTLKDVSLRTRFMAEKMSLPYLRIESSGFSGQVRLSPSMDGPQYKVRLVDFSETVANGVATIKATYCIERIGHSCIAVDQIYEFHPLKDAQRVPGTDRKVTEPLEPSSTVLGQRFFPMVYYRFYGTAGETLTRFTSAQRLHFRVDGQDRSFSGIFKDLLVKFDPPSDPFDYGTDEYLEEDPLQTEDFIEVIKNGNSPADHWDNYHITWKSHVAEPLTRSFSPAGCLECVHIHWRWIGIGPLVMSWNPDVWIPEYSLFNGNPLIPPGSRQSVTIGLARYKASEENSADPFILNISPRLERIAGEDQVFWYEAESPDVNDAFFTHGGFFSVQTPRPEVRVFRGDPDSHQHAGGNGGDWKIMVTGLPGKNVSIEGSSDLVTWNSLAIHNQAEQHQTYDLATLLPMAGIHFFRAVLLE